MELVADGTLRAVGDHLARLIFERGVRFEPAEIRPAFVEPRGHAQVRLWKGAGVPDIFWEVKIAPAAGWQGFNLGVREAGDLFGKIEQGT